MRITVSRAVRPGWMSVCVALIPVLYLAAGAGTARFVAGRRMSAAGSFEQDSTRFDKSTVVGPSECSECHESEVKAWRKTHHRKSLDVLWDSDATDTICEALGIDDFETSDLCTQCHTTPNANKSELGVSCESCHQPARTWIKIHNDFGEGVDKTDAESPEHRKQRWAACDRAGMIRKAEIYDLGENCFQCHTVPQEALVNTGAHPAGSAFELVGWSQGEVRHSFSESSKTNKAASAERKRLLYVVGRALDLEHALRGFAKATVENGVYAVKMKERIKNAAQKLTAIQEHKPLAEVQKMLDAVKKLGDVGKMRLTSKAQVEAAATSVEKAAQEFAMKHDGKDLTPIDALLKSVEYKGKVY